MALMMQSWLRDARFFSSTTRLRIELLICVLKKISKVLPLSLRSCQDLNSMINKFVIIHCFD